MEGGSGELAENGVDADGGMKAERTCLMKMLLSIIRHL